MIWFLIRAYAFLISFEHILFVWFDIDTMFKPYRIIGLLLITLLFPRLAKEASSGSQKFLVIFLAFVLVHFFIVSSYTRVNTFGFLNFFSQVLFNGVTFLAICSYVKDPKKYFAIVEVFVFGVVVNSVFISYLFFVGGQDGRLSGFSDDQNTAAFAMSISLFSIIYLLFYCPDKRYSHGLRRVTGFFSIGILLVATLLTGSRSGLVFLVVGMPALFFFQSPSFQKVVVSCVIGGLVFYFFTTTSLLSEVELIKKPDSAFQRFNRTNEDIRWDLWKAGLFALQESEYFGIGMAQFQSQFEIFSRAMNKVNQQVRLERQPLARGLGLHNLYLEILVGTGIVGVFLFARFIFGRIFEGKPRFELLNLNGFYWSLVLCFCIYIGLVDAILSGYFWFVLFLLSNLERIQSFFILRSDRHKNSRVIKASI